MPSESRSRVKPTTLRPGDTVGIVAPASNIKKDMLTAGCDALRELGYVPAYSDSILDKDIYFAGTVERRVREFEEMFSREDVKAVVCARGGYGSNYLLNTVDWRRIAKHPKVFVGYSDITSLLTWMTDSLGWITFHGPMAAKDFAHADGVDVESWRSALTGLGSWELSRESAAAVKPLVEGSTEGMLYGGCLSMLVASLGTPYEAHTDGTVLFMEDIGAKPYQIDRMLMQLKLAGKLDKVRGIVFGEMVDCYQVKSQDYTLEEVILRVVGDLRIPIAYGLRSGHVSRQNVTLPLGVRVALEVNSQSSQLRFLESATV